MRRLEAVERDRLMKGYSATAFAFISPRLSFWFTKCLSCIASQDEVLGLPAGGASSAPYIGPKGNDNARAGGALPARIDAPVARATSPACLADVLRVLTKKDSRS